MIQPTLFADLDTHRVVELTEYHPEDDTVRFCLEGGGFQHSMPRVVFHMQHKPAPARTWKRTLATGDWTDEKYPAWTDGRHWNGWLMPHFEFDVAYSLIPTVHSSMSYDEINDQFVHIVEDDQEPCLYPAKWIDTDVGKVKVYAIGDGFCWDEVSEPVPSLFQTVARMKAEIIADVFYNPPGMKQIPVTIKSFGDLHDYRDANEYGGFCDDELSDRFIEHFGRRDRGEGVPESVPEAYIAFCNEAQGAIDAWLGRGGLLDELARRATEAALAAGCVLVQEALGVQHGDFAGLYFSGDNWDWTNRFRGYIEGEINQAKLEQGKVQ